MRKRVLQIVRRLRQLQQERSRLLDALLVDEPLLRGSLSLVKRTCGKPNCHCAEAPAHEVWVLASTRDNQRRCQVVRQADVDLMRLRLQTYKNFRTAFRRIQAIARKEKALLNGLLEARARKYD